MKILLIYSPPWKIVAEGGNENYGDEGMLDADGSLAFNYDALQIPWGVMSLEAVMRRAGHDVTIWNLYDKPWVVVNDLIKKFECDVYGISCFTLNRRGSISVAECIREHHLNAHITMGGPHASFLSEEMMSHCSALDSVVVGEGENTMLELLERLSAKEPIVGVSGLLSRQGDKLAFGGVRPRIKDLDSIPSIFDHGFGGILITSRGCPGECTYCGAPALWERRVTMQSAERVLEELDIIINKHGIKRFGMKDDTFTMKRSRTIAICKGIVERGLKCLWTCDTRVASIDDECLEWMRRAGCWMISFGVESGSPEVLKGIKKRTTPEMIEKATKAAKKFGFFIRYYLMIGNRGESPKTIQDTMELVERTRPSAMLFSRLSVFPGTADFKKLREEGHLTSEDYFTDKSLELTAELGSKHKGMPEVYASLSNQLGSFVRLYEYSADELALAMERVKDCDNVCWNYAEALLSAGKFEEAEKVAQKAIDLGFAYPSLCYNIQAHSQAARGNMQEALDILEAGINIEDSFSLLGNNISIMVQWAEKGGTLSLAMPDAVPNLPAGLQPFWPGPITL